MLAFQFRNSSSTTYIYKCIYCSLTLIYGIWDWNHKSLCLRITLTGFSFRVCGIICYPNHKSICWVVWSDIQNYPFIFVPTKNYLILYTLTALKSRPLSKLTTREDQTFVFHILPGPTYIVNISKFWFVCLDVVVHIRRPKKRGYTNVSSK